LISKIFSCKTKAQRAVGTESDRIGQCGCDYCQTARLNGGEPPVDFSTPVATAAMAGQPMNESCIPCDPSESERKVFIENSETLPNVIVPQDTPLQTLEPEQPVVPSIPKPELNPPPAKSRIDSGGSWHHSSTT
jgi:hypothetical protein